MVDIHGDRSFLFSFREGQIAILMNKWAYSWRMNPRLLSNCHD